MCYACTIHAVVVATIVSAADANANALSSSPVGCTAWVGVSSAGVQLQHLQAQEDLLTEGTMAAVNGALRSEHRPVVLSWIASEWVWARGEWMGRDG